MKRYVGWEERYSEGSFIPKGSGSKEELEQDNDIEKNQIVKDLENIEPIYKYLVPLGPGLQCKYS